MAAKEEVPAIVYALVNAKFNHPRTYFCASCMADNLSGWEMQHNHQKRNHKTLQAMKFGDLYCFKKEDIDSLFEGSGGFDASGVRVHYKTDRFYPVYYMKSRSSEIHNEVVKGRCVTCWCHFKKPPFALFCSLECKSKCKVSPEELDKVKQPLEEEAKILEMEIKAKRDAEEAAKKEAKEADMIEKALQKMEEEAQRIEEQNMGPSKKKRKTQIEDEQANEEDDRFW